VYVEVFGDLNKHKPTRFEVEKKPARPKWDKIKKKKKYIYIYIYIYKINKYRECVEKPA
jgi:hypothetical protein